VDIRPPSPNTDVLVIYIFPIIASKWHPFAVCSSISGSSHVVFVICSYESE